jgi:phytoene dehydrogenase-like protein
MHPHPRWPLPYSKLLHVVPYREVGTPRTHRRYLSRVDGTYGPIPSRRPMGMLSMPFNTTSIQVSMCHVTCHMHALR